MHQRKSGSREQRRLQRVVKRDSAALGKICWVENAIDDGVRIVDLVGRF